MKRQGGVRVRTMRGKSPMRRQPDAARAKIANMVQRLAAEDPKRARAFLMLLRQATRSERRRAVLAAFGDLGRAITEAGRPTPLKVRPASLADSWNAVGRSIGSSMIKYGEQHDHYAG